MSVTVPAVHPDSGHGTSTLVVLAAGASRRFGRPKQLEQVGPHGETLIDYALIDAARAGFTRAVLVTRSGLRAALSERLAQGGPPLSVEWVEQSVTDLPDTWRTATESGAVVFPERVRPWGTAHALWSARAVVPGPFAVVIADDFYGSQAYRAASDFLGRVDPKRAHFAIMGYELGRTLSPAGGVSRAICDADDNGSLSTVTEVLNIRRSSEGIRGTDSMGHRVILSGDEVVSMNFWGFTTAVFPAIEAALTAFMGRAANDPTTELHLPAVIDELVREGHARVDVLPAGAETFGVTYEADRDDVVARLAQLTTAGEYPIPSGRAQTCS